MLNFSRRQVEYGTGRDTYYAVPFRDFSLRGVGGGCLIILALAVCVAGGLAFGNWVGGPGGAAVGGVVGYLAPFVGFGVYIQRTVGWATWLGIERPKPPR